MRLELFEYLIAIEKYGSMNKAAEHLYMSQPNLTASIQNFEKELGYSLLNRNHRGVSFTEQGKKVLIIAHNILEETEKLNTVDSKTNNLNLRISIGNSQEVFHAISKELISFDQADEIHLVLENRTVMDAMESVYAHENDLAYIIVDEGRDKLVKEYCRTHSLSFHSFEYRECILRIRKQHPLAKKNAFSLEKLWDFPFVDYPNRDISAYGAYQKYINPQKRILIDNGYLRNDVIRNTNAYSIGIGYPEKEKDFFTFSLEHLKMHLVEIRRKSDQDNDLYNRIRNHLK